MENSWLTYAKRLQAISATGLPYCTDQYDKERYEEILKISLEMMAQIGDVPLQKIEALLTMHSKGYETPKIDVRGFVNDIAYEGLNVNELLPLVPEQKSHFIFFVVDTVTIESPGYPLLCVDLLAGRGKNFRVVACAVQGVENNLSAGNLCFDEVADMVDDEGIFHGVEF